MYCGNCGKEIDNKNKFCPLCGNRLQQETHEEKEQYVTVKASGENIQPIGQPLPSQNSGIPVRENTYQSQENISYTSQVQQIAVPEVQNPTKPKKKSSKKLLLIIGAVILVAVLTVAGVFLFMGSDKEQKPTKAVGTFNAAYSDSEGNDYSYCYDIVEQDGYRIYKWTEYDSETKEKTHETIYEYDAKNNSETRYYYGSDNALYQKNVYTLSDDGKYESCKIYEIIDGEESFLYEYYFVGLDMVGKVDVPDDYAFVEYDEYNRIVVWEEYYSDGNWYKTYSEYNNLGLVSEKTVGYNGYETLYTLTPVS